MPPEQLGAQLAALSASFKAEKEYQHDRWHKLANDLTPVINLPERLTRDIAKIQGNFDGRFGAFSRDIERSITAAVERAIEPVNADIALLKTDVEELKRAKLQDDGARGVIAAMFKSPLIAWLAALVATAWAILSGKAP